MRKKKQSWSNDWIDKVNRYYTVRKLGMEECIIKKSRFIGYAMPVETEEEAIQFIAQIRKEHHAATHHCFAYMIGQRNEVQKQSDDGEPSGTAGKPILEVMKKQDLKNVVIVVTRYFGGTMLGAGGLIRAYSEGASLAVNAAERIEQVRHREVLVEIDYSWLGKVENELRSRQIILGETQFTEKVVLLCYPLYKEIEGFQAWMTDLTQGQSNIVIGKEIWIRAGK